jgi:hypothetical protein
MAVNPIYERGMFSGPPQVTPQPSLGTGITSGLLDEPMPAAPAQDQNMLAATGLQAAAESMDGLFASIDQAEDVEGIINALRGDQKPIKQRYTELADLVGNTDANKTPESVLALLQPTFQIMDTLQEGEGGLASLMQQQGPSATQPDQVQQAMSMMEQGAQPVMRANGSPRFGEIAAIPGVMQGFNALQPPRQPTPFMMPGVTPQGQADYARLPAMTQQPNMYLQGNLPPSQRMIDPASAQQFGEEYYEFLKPYMPQKRSAETINQSYQSMLEPYIQQPRSKEALAAEAQEFFGEGDQQNQDIQAALALARYGSQIAQTPGSILQALTTPAGDFAADLSKVASQKAQQERQLKEFAFGQEQAETDRFNQQQFQIASTAIQQSETDQNNWQDARRAIAQDVLNKGLSTDTVNSDRFNNSALAAWSANNQFAVLPAEPYVYTRQDGKSEVFSAQRTANGLRRITPNGLERMPENFIPLDANTLKTLTGTGALDLKDAQQKDLLIPDPKSPIGYTGVPGFFLNGSFFISPNGDVRNAQLAPEGFLVGNQRDAVEFTTKDEVGRVFLVPKQGPNMGKKILVGTTDANGNEIGTGGLAYELIPAKYDENGEVIEGNPFVQTIPDDGLRFENLQTSVVGRYQQRILESVDALNDVQTILELIPDAVGPYNSLRQFASNPVASLVPGSADEFLRFGRTERGKAVMERFVRKLQSANALSDRFAVAEQEIIARLAVDPNEGFQDPEAAMVAMTEVARILYNDLSEARGVISDQPHYFLSSIPSGKQSDPFAYDDQSVAYLNMLEKQDQLPENTYIQMTVGDAKALGFAGNWQNQNDANLVTIKYNSRRR